ncbi:MAG: endonuclease/exonuclease/phosphatase family protein [Bacteroidales bacterium]|nr:endonuclease/exonuclease/phosphatase family protein [Bacteroidales bacterium]
MSKIVDRTILILNLLAAFGLLISYLAPLVNPSKFILPALFGLSYPYLLMLNLAILSYWMIRLKKEILISVVVVLLGWNHLNNLLPLNFKASEIPDTVPLSRLFKVLSYNVRGFDIYGWTSDPQIKNEIFNFIEQQEPDILCFQEYYSSPRRGETQSDLSRQLRFLPESAVYYTADHSNRNGWGIATYSRYPIIKKSRIPFNSSSNAAMYTDILVHSDTIRVINVHLQSIKFRQEDYAFMDTVRLKYSNEQLRGIRNIGSQLKTAFSLRAEQADMIFNYIKDAPYPVVVIGDFNDTPQSYAYRKIRRGMKDAFRKAGRGFGNTYAGELPSFRIDYIMYSEPLIPFRFQRIKNDYSDHFPISTWLYHPEPVTSE